MTTMCINFVQSFSSPKIDFWKCLSNGSIRSNMVSEDFLDISEWPRMHFRPPKGLGKIWRKFFFRFFVTFLKQFLLHFSLKMKQKWIWKNRKSDFFKDEAINQKSGTVNPLGYVLTVFHDRGDPPPESQTWNWQCPQPLTQPIKPWFLNASESFKLKLFWNFKDRFRKTRKNTK